MRDQEINKLIIDAIQKIKQREGKPIKLTKARIGRTIGQLAILEKSWINFHCARKHSKDMWKLWSSIRREESIGSLINAHHRNCL